MDAVVTTRRVCLVVAMALLAGSCAGRTTIGPAVGGATPTTQTDNASTATTRGNANAATGTTHRDGTTNGGGNAPSTTTKNGDAIHDTSRGGPGDFAGVLLAPGPASNVVLDLLVQPGVSADANVISTLRQILGASSGKPVTVHESALNSSSTNYDAATIVRLADAQGRAQGNDTGVIHLLYLKGSFTDDSVLGVTVRADTTAIFPDQIAQASSPIVTPQRLEQAVDTHELGHVMGLVDLYLDDNRDDPQHPGHSTNPHSVMYWAVETDLVSQVLDGPPPVSYDAADQADLQRIHAGAAPASR